MQRKIIVGHDLHDGGRDALAFGQLLARATGAELIVASVFPIGMVPRRFEPRWHEQQASIALEIQRAADSVGAQAEVFPSSTRARGLHDLAEETDADLVVVGSSHHGKVGQILAGNVGLGLLRGLPCALAIAPKGYCENAGDELGTITVGIDASDESRLALLYAIDLAKASGAEMKLVAVVEPPPIVYGKGVGSGRGYQELKEAIEEQLREQLNEAMEAVPGGVRADTTLVSGDPAEQLAAAAGSDSGVLILGSRAYGPIRRVLLGSVSTALIRSAPCAVIIHPRGT